LTAARWDEFAAAAADLAESGRQLLYQHGPGLGFLATVRKDGGPRLHPVCPVVAHGGLYAFITNQSPKVHDLRRDGRYALHSFPSADVDDEFSVTGRAAIVEDPSSRQPVYEAFMAQGTTTSDDTLFELLIERALHAKYGPRPSWPPVNTRWSAG
jgi:general stress protein 26